MSTSKQELSQQYLLIEYLIWGQAGRIVEAQMKLEPLKADSDSIRRQLEAMGIDPVGLLFESPKEAQPANTKPAEAKP